MAMIETKLSTSYHYHICVFREREIDEDRNELSCTIGVQKSRTFEEVLLSITDWVGRCERI